MSPDYSPSAAFGTPFLLMARPYDRRQRPYIEHCRRFDIDFEPFFSAGASGARRRRRCPQQPIFTHNALRCHFMPSRHLLLSFFGAGKDSICADRPFRAAFCRAAARPPRLACFRCRDAAGCLPAYAAAADFQDRPTSTGAYSGFSPVLSRRSSSHRRFGSSSSFIIRRCCHPDGHRLSNAHLMRAYTARASRRRATDGLLVRLVVVELPPAITALNSAYLPRFPSPLRLRARLKRTSPATVLSLTASLHQRGAPHGARALIKILLMIFSIRQRSHTRHMRFASARAMIALPRDARRYSEAAIVTPPICAQASCLHDEYSSDLSCAYTRRQFLLLS